MRNKVIQMIQEGKDVPEEHQDIVDDIEARYEEIDAICIAEFSGIVDIVYPRDPHREKRELWREHIEQMTFPEVGYAMLDGADYYHIIYSLIEKQDGAEQ